MNLYNPDDLYKTFPGGTKLPKPLYAEPYAFQPPLNFTINEGEINVGSFSKPEKQPHKEGTQKPKATIPLAKGYDQTKIEYPGFLSLKIDGTPIRCDVTIQSGAVKDISRRTRQGLENLSAKDQFDQLINALNASGALRDGCHTFIAEVTHQSHSAFKDSGGIIRKKTPQSGLVLNLFDYQYGNPRAPFEERIERLNQMMAKLEPHPCFNTIPQHFVSNQREFDQTRAMLLQENPNCEGLIYRQAYAPFKPGARHWDYQKILMKPTMDLLVVSYAEAKCTKTGQGKGMVGRINCAYHGEIIGVCPGTMSDEERRREWQNHKDSDQTNRTRIIQVEHKKDPSYKALREATFMFWRPEKKEPSYA